MWRSRSECKNPDFVVYLTCDIKVKAHIGQGQCSCRSRSSKDSYIERLGKNTAVMIGTE